MTKIGENVRQTEETTRQSLVPSRAGGFAESVVAGNRSQHRIPLGAFDIPSRSSLESGVWVIDVEQARRLIGAFDHFSRSDRSTRSGRDRACLP